MANSNKKQTGGVLSSVFGVAKKLSSTGLNVLNHAAPGTVDRLSQSPKDEQVVQGTARQKSILEKNHYENPQQMIREHLPKVSSQLFGQHYKKVNNIASFISPDLNNKISDYFFDQLNDFVSQLSSVEKLLKEVGAKELNELSQDAARSQRISQALSNQNKIFASLLGAVTGATGVLGSALDVPTSLGLALRSIYQTGRAYGFELKQGDHAVVEYIFKDINLGSVAEKQALLMAVRTFANVLETHNVGQLQQLVGSDNNADLIKKYFINEDGSSKWTWLDQLPRFGLATKLLPLANIGISATYSWNLVDDAVQKAQNVFQGARQYLLQHPNEQLGALEAFEKSVALIAQASPLLLDTTSVGVNPLDKSVLIDQSQPIQNEMITDIQIEKKSQKQDEVDDSVNVEDGIQLLKELHVEAPQQNTTIEQTSELKNKEVPADQQADKTIAAKKELLSENPTAKVVDSVKEQITDTNLKQEKDVTTVKKTKQDTTQAKVQQKPAKPSMSSRSNSNKN